MAFATGNGKYNEIPYIYAALKSKVIFQAGVGASSDLSVNADAETAYYWKRGTANVASAAAGTKINFTAVGATRQNVDLSQSVQYGDVIPGANIDSVTPDQVQDLVTGLTVKAANEINAKGLTKLYSVPVANDVESAAALTKDTVYATIIDARKKFITVNKNGTKPDTIIVGPKVEALLYKSPEFQRTGTIGDDVVAEAYIGRIAGMNVLLAEDLDEAKQTSGTRNNKYYDFLVYNKDAFMAATGCRNEEVGSGLTLGYPGGVACAGEICYGYDIADSNQFIWAVNAAG